MNKSKNYFDGISNNQINLSRHDFAIKKKSSIAKAQRMLKIKNSFLFAVIALTHSPRMEVWESGR
ncbi:hypothetical protein [Caldithrix abyssi]|uniref:Uncharacterized protein n=1 Tax=Caldithrix abyssi DSM 13497 TaxID=880073 RepID=A0A1J1CDN5_CALAY|nr:hypothetical protein [Caldithrix abyssi]APF20098.1 hypothetical protein Cabys_3350 [Caldithrix abyssi DSM 13497]